MAKPHIVDNLLLFPSSILRPESLHAQGGEGGSIKLTITDTQPRTADHINTTAYPPSSPPPTPFTQAGFRHCALSGQPQKGHVLFYRKWDFLGENGSQS